MSTVRHLERNGEPRLAFRLDAPASGARARVLLVHGYADYAARFDHVVRLWKDRGLSVGSLDLRGHGLSGGPRGHAAAFDDYVRDVTDALARLESEPGFSAGLPLSLFGHSMGGLVAVTAAHRLGGRLSGVAMTSPFFGLLKPPPLPLQLLAQVAGRVAPGLRQPSGLEGKDMSHDPEIVRKYDTDPLGFHHVTAGWFLQVTRAQARALKDAPKLRVPLFCIAAGADRVVAVEATRRFFAAAGSVDKELDVRPELYHEVLNEPDWQPLATRLSDRMLRWSGA